MLTFKGLDAEVYNISSQQDTAKVQFLKQFPTHSSYILKVVLLVSEICFFLGGGSEHEMFSSSFTAQIDRSTLSFDTMPSMSGSESSMAKPNCVEWALILSRYQNGFSLFNESESRYPLSR